VLLPRIKVLWENFAGSYKSAALYVKTLIIKKELPLIIDLVDSDNVYSGNNLRFYLAKLVMNKSFVFICTRNYGCKTE
jgi:hypothetical protein